MYSEARKLHLMGKVVKIKSEKVLKEVKAVFFKLHNDDILCALFEGIKLSFNDLLQISINYPLQYSNDSIGTQIFMIRLRRMIFAEGKSYFFLMISDMMDNLRLS